LFLVDFEGVAVLHVELPKEVSIGCSIFERTTGAQIKAHQTEFAYSLGVVGRVHSLPVKEEANTRDVLALTVAERIHELLELGSPLDLEEDLVVVIRHLDVEVFRLAGVLRLLHIVWATVVGHGCGE
jgi:hypothetical protein